MKVHIRCESLSAFGRIRLDFRCFFERHVPGWLKLKASRSRVTALVKSVGNLPVVPRCYVQVWQPLNEFE